MIDVSVNTILEQTSPRVRTDITGSLASLTALKRRIVVEHHSQSWKQGM